MEKAKGEIKIASSSPSERGREDRQNVGLGVEDVLVEWDHAGVGEEQEQIL